MVVVSNGEALESAMKLERLSLDEVLEAARKQGIENLDEVKIAVLEPDGKFSFITRDANPTGSDK